MEQPTNKLTLWLAKKIAVVIIKWRGNRYHYIKAIKQAEDLTRGRMVGKGWQKGKRSYIYFIGGKYRILNRKQVQWWRNNSKLRAEIKVSQMQNIQLYDTDGHINSHPIYTGIVVKGVNVIYVRSKDLKDEALIAVKKAVSKL